MRMAYIGEEEEYGRREFSWASSPMHVDNNRGNERLRSRHTVFDV